MEITFSVDHPSFSFDQSSNFLHKAENLLKGEGISKDVLLGVVFVTDEALLEINKQFLNHDYYTDIITFTIEESDVELEAEIYISIDRITDNARELKLIPEDELLRVFLHGILHLVGYEDESDAQKAVMRSKETHYMNM